MSSRETGYPRVTTVFPSYSIRSAATKRLFERPMRAFGIASEASRNKGIVSKSVTRRAPVAPSALIEVGSTVEGAVKFLTMRNRLLGASREVFGVADAVGAIGSAILDVCGPPKVVGVISEDRKSVV